MEKTECGRCGRKEYIATHQFVKFSGKQVYLCAKCWKKFRQWYHQPEEREKNER